MIKANLMLPQGYEQLIYSYLLNFQSLNDTYQTKYKNSKKYNEPDIFIFADPDWEHPDFPDGLALFDPEHNVAAILGLSYFGELKKATLTLAWAIAHRNGFVPCHGGMKQLQTNNQKKYTMAAFGLSGSGKSTITLADHHNKYGLKVLHDDAFIISKNKGSTTALEPAYFDKTQDYPMGSKEITYFLTAQNIGITRNTDNNKVLITDDVRNGNGRTVKSYFATPNRVNQLDEKIDAIYWIMKDDSLPPLVRLDNSILATVFGATLATKRSTAENIDPSFDLDKLVIEPFANPFRVYPLEEDYFAFKELFENQKIACYILNTSHFNGKDITPKITLNAIESIIDNTGKFSPFGPLLGMSYLEIENFKPDFSNVEFLLLLKKNIDTRITYLIEENEKNTDFNQLPLEALNILQELEFSLKTLIED